MEIRRATEADTELLVSIRLDFLRDLREITEEGAQALAGLLREYFPVHIGRGDFVALLGYEGGELAAAAFMAYSDFPPSDLVSATRRAMAANIYTYPAHRRRGHASKLVLALADIARADGAGILDLLATEAGEKVYEQIGFVKNADTAMRLDLRAGKEGPL